MPRSSRIASHVLIDLLEPVAAEVVVAEVALGELRARPDPAGERALVERDAHDHADVVALAGGQQLVLGRLVEDVVDHLHGVHDAGLDQLDRVRRLVVVDRDAEEADLALVLERLDRLEPAPAPDPLVAPDVELLDVEDVHAEVATACARCTCGRGRRGTPRRGRSRRGAGQPQVLRRDLARDDDPLVALAHDLADELLRVPVARRPSAVSMKFTPRSIARCSACTDSSSCAPSHMSPPMPQAP